VQAGSPRQPDSTLHSRAPRALATAIAPRSNRPRAALTPHLLMILVLVLTSGCTSFREYVGNRFKVGPNYKKPSAPVADHWIDANDIRVRSKSDDLSRWWGCFHDPVLDRLIADAYRQNLTLRQAAFRVLQARAVFGVAFGNIFPQAQQLTGDHTQNAVTTQTANRSFVAQRYYPQWDFGLTMGWELDFWGRLRRAIEAAGDQVDASVENYDDVLVTMLGDVASDYALIRIYQAQIAYTKANVELQNSVLTLVKARYGGGTVTELDVDQAESVRAQTASQIPALEINMRQTCNALCVLLGMPPEELLNRIGDGAIPTAPPDVVVGIPADLLRRRPDVRSAERTAAAQAEQIGIAMAEFYPHIYLNTTMSYSAETFPKLFNSKALQATTGPSFQWNVLNYGRILNNVRAQDALFQQQVLQYQITVLNAAQQVENGLVTFLKSQQQTLELVSAVDAAGKAVNIAVVQYKGGLIDFNRVALLEQNLVQYQLLLAQARGAIVTGLITTYRALGGGWDYRLDPASNTAPGLGTPRPEVVPAVPPQPIEHLPPPPALEQR
jgi:NodT family efflux transporter outer membrane factor (OMF) lipoprotein